MKILFFLLCIIIQAANAADFFYCPKTNNYIYPNDTLDYVKQNCRNPTSEDTQPIVIKDTQNVLQYIYNFRPNREIKIYKPNSLVISFIEDKVIDILVEGKSVKETDYCSSKMIIKIGSTRKEVFYFCRHPSIVQKIDKTISEKTVEQTILTYQDDEYSIPTKLYFHDGILVKID